MLDSNKASLEQLTEEYLEAVDGEDDSKWGLVRANPKENPNPAVTNPAVTIVLLTTSLCRLAAEASQGGQLQNVRGQPQ